MFDLDEWRFRRKISSYRKALKKRDIYSDSSLDNQVSSYFRRRLSSESNLVPGSGNLENKNLAILASGLADVGGHTICLKRFVESFCDDYRLTIFLSDIDRFEAQAVKTNQHLSAISAVEGVGYKRAKLSPKRTIIQLYNSLVAFSPKIVFVCINMGDVVSAAVLSLLRARTDIKILYFNHGDHLYSLGIDSAHLVLGARPRALELLNSSRGGVATQKIALQGVRKEELRQYSDEQINKTRTDFGVDQGMCLTLTGCASGKLFDKNGDSLYFEFIRDLLSEKKNLKHLLLSELTLEQEEIINKVFAGYENEKSRLIIKDRVNDFDLILQSADLFIDSFPVGGALVHIDMMRNIRPTVVKKNPGEPLFSFEEYLPPGYKYAFSDLLAMKTGIIELLNDAELRKSVAEEGYKYYLSNNEFFSVKKQYESILNDVLLL